MSSVVRNPKDFWAGAIYVAVGAGAIVIARNYPMGTVLRMGPAYFPTLLGGVLALLGAASLVRSFVRPGEGVGAFAFKGLLLVLLPTVVAGAIVRRTGLVVALPVLVLVSAYASSKFTWRSALAVAVGMTIFCGLVFVKGLGIPLPILGSLLGG
ncbi:MAG: tripartite tricarboxylate transporter TctB family protein [Deltaproteobacteria bacterium]|nr:tripartite tricarboxylate transporter TctB family protein [Deltaproteobacteria bacterium]